MIPSGCRVMGLDTRRAMFAKPPKGKQSPQLGRLFSWYPGAGYAGRAGTPGRFDSGSLAMYFLLFPFTAGSRERPAFYMQNKPAGSGNGLLNRLSRNGDVVRVHCSAPWSCNGPVRKGQTFSPRPLAGKFSGTAAGQADRARFSDVARFPAVRLLWSRDYINCIAG